MANDVRIRFRSFLPGAGFDGSGGAKQGKTRVVGTVTVTSYTGSSGEPLTARDIGLSTIDALQLRVREEVQAEFSGAAKTRHVGYSLSAARFYLWTDDSPDGATTLDRNSVLAAATETLEFDALGDSAHDVELS